VLGFGESRTYFSVDATNWYTVNDMPAATATVAGKVELATNAEVTTGSDTARSVTAAGLHQKTASATAVGLVELATNAEAIAGTDTTRAVVSSALQAKTNEIGVHAYIAGAGAADVLTLTPVPAATAYAAGQRFLFLPTADNTGACTLNVSGLGAKNIKKSDGAGALANPAAADLDTVLIADVIYDGTQFVLQNPGVVSSGGAVTQLNNATESELVTVGATTTQLDAEANLTFDGSTLTLSGALAVDGGTLVYNTSEADLDARFAGSTETNLLYLNAGEESVIIGATGKITGNSRERLSVQDSAAGTALILSQPTNASYAGRANGIRSTRAGSADFNYLFMESNNGSDREFVVTGLGVVTADGSINGCGADYQEYFETVSGQRYPLGKTVVLIDGKVALADDHAELSVMGVTRPSNDEDHRGGVVVGNTAWNSWTKKYLKDEFGVYEREDVEVLNWIGKGSLPMAVYARDADNHDIPESGVTVTLQSERKLNPLWDPDAEYVQRGDRPEWQAIGLVGQVPILVGQRMDPRWHKMKDISEGVEKWFIR
jgi:hypothetical protein